MIKRWKLSILLLLSCGSLFSQDGFITGRVADSITHEPLAFVSIVYNGTGRGVVTNLDGFFKIPRTNNIQYFKLRYIGYKAKTVVYDPLKFRNNQVITLSPVPVELGEVVVFPTENPAHRIIKLATENRSRNNPEKSGPFSYTSYDKMVFGIDTDSLGKPVITDTSKAFVIPDSVPFGMDQKNKIDAARFVEKQYLFMMESVSSRKFLSPEKDKEEVIASKVSGISQPSFVVMARQFQSFSFYDNFVSIANRQLLNPVSDGSTDKYFFQIQDTLYSERSDTVFIISFRPLKGRNFDGMKGVLYINSNGYAIQNVLAEAYDPKGALFTVAIQQQYDFIDNVRWFPVLLNTTIRFNLAGFNPQGPPVTILGTGKSYILNINLNPAIENNEFSNVRVEVSPDAHKQPEEVWNAYRSDSLNIRELETYRVIDSLGKAEHLDRTINSFETIMTGYIPGQYWMFNLARFISYNQYEGFAFGAGGRTTEKFSRWLRLDGYAAYGLKDKALKYKAGLAFNLWREKELELNVFYRDDIRESGGIIFTEPWSISGSSFYRQYMVRVMDKVRDAELSLGFRALKYLTTQIYMNQSRTVPTNDYSYSLTDENPMILINLFYINETGVRLRYAFGETFMKSPRGNMFSMGTKYPVINLNVAKGTAWFGGAFEYLRTELKVTKVFQSKSWGHTRVALMAGAVTGEAPYGKLYAGRGSYGTFALETEQSFGTMRFNEFLSDRFVSLFIKQDFGSLLFKPRGKFRPEIALVQNIGYGKLVQAGPHKNITYRTMEKGYYEGGLLVNNLFRMSYLSYGLGALYRYGPYAFSKPIDNFAFKITLKINI